MNKKKNNYLIKKYFAKHIENFSTLNFKEIEKLISLIIYTAKKGGTVYTCGNGGSAYNASHFVTDWNKFLTKKIKKFKSVSLCDNIGLITATGNDIAFENIFIEQLKSIFKKEDLLICISGSGNSKNLLKAANFVNKKKGNVFSLVGFDGGKLKKISKFYLHVKSYDMQICEDTHIMVGHIVMKAISEINVK